ncbi:uncharacterized protein LOC113286568 [Papaver somniferum]|uniref:uncharacterized protein LOC113286568 n=1 Tax=Papaver somniferum TaxID=3469 RepID=UPI000E6FB857|nr:uncharacterized protein LOC113286568 [Papaver somniferum]
MMNLFVNMRFFRKVEDDGLVNFDSDYDLDDEDDLIKAVITDAEEESLEVEISMPLFLNTTEIVLVVVLVRIAEEAANLYSSLFKEDFPIRPRNQKGIRQGDPISPFIFIIVDELLSKMIGKAASDGLISGFQNILFAFQLVTGLSVNFRKSAVVGIGDDNNAAYCASIFGCQIAEFPINYLGIPLGSKSKNKAVLDVLIARFQQKLRTWRRRYLSKGKRLLLINSVLASTPIYFLSMFQRPISVIKTLEKIMRRFLWGSSDNSKKRSWVSWSKANISKVIGGIGIKKLKLVNKSLHCKWIWRYGKEKDSLWRQLV